MNSVIEYISLQFLGVYLKDFWNIDKDKLDNQGKLVYNAINSYNINKEDIMSVIYMTLNGNCNSNPSLDTTLSIAKVNMKVKDLADNIHNLITIKLIENQDLIIATIKEKINLYLDNNREIINNYQYNRDMIINNLDNSKHQDVIQEILLEYDNMINKLEEENIKYENMLNYIDNIMKNSYVLERKSN